MPIPDTRLAMDVRLGGHYLTQKNILLEPVPGSKGRPKGRTSDLTADKYVNFFRVVEGKVDTSKMFPILKAYQLTVLSEPAEPVTKKSLVDEAVKICTEAGCFVHEHENYLRVSYKGMNIFRIYREGHLGWLNEPEMPWLKDLLFWKNVTRLNAKFRVSLFDLKKNGSMDTILKTIEASA